MNEILGAIILISLLVVALAMVLWYDNYTNKGRREREAKKDNAIIKLCETLTLIYSEENNEEGEKNND